MPTNVTHTGHARTEEEAKALIEKLLSAGGGGNAESGAGAGANLPAPLLPSQPAVAGGTVAAANPVASPPMGVTTNKGGVEMRATSTSPKAMPRAKSVMDVSGGSPANFQAPAGSGGVTMAAAMKTKSEANLLAAAAANGGGGAAPVPKPRPRGSIASSSSSAESNLGNSQNGGGVVSPPNSGVSVISPNSGSAVSPVSGAVLSPDPR